NDKITVPEIQIILSPIKSILGRNLDVFAISSCWAGTAENFYELSNYADYAVASQTLMYRYPFDIILPTLKEMPYTTPYQLAKSFAETYISTYKAYGMDKYIASAIDLSKMNNLGKKMKLFSTALMNYDQDKIVELRSNTQRADTDNYRDLYHFAELSSNVDQLRNEANSVMNAVKEAVISDSSELPANFNGMSIYFPREAHSGYFSYHYEEYKELRFSKDTGWDKFLDTFIQGGIELQLEIPKSNSFNFPENVLSVVHNYMIKSHTYSGENPLVILIKPSIIDELKKISINVKVNMGGDHGVYYYADWQPVESSSNTEGIFVIPAEKISGEKEVKIGLKAENTQNSIIGYSIAAYAEFEKVDENNTEQIAWSGIEARKEGKLEKINEEKYYFVLIPANTKVNVKLNYAGTNNETDFDLYVGISPPQGTGLPRIYKFDYRGFTIDANETVPMSGSIGSYDTEVKIYLLVRAYQGNGEYSLVVGRYGF
ncbi:MAG: clostripain-related cysteine peptidase, partial [Candidatus Thermoplasmatota archaeon]